MLDKLLGPRQQHYSESDINGHVLAAGESMIALTPGDSNNDPIEFDKSNPLWVQLNEARQRVTVEICYCSTLGDCWTLHAGGSKNSSTVESGHCAIASAVGFEQ